MKSNLTRSLEFLVHPLATTGKHMALHLVPRSLQYFEQVAQFGSIQAASREAGVSASAIHRQIKSLEDDLGKLLFDRDAKGMTLTPAGRLILDIARNWRLDSAKLWSIIQAERGIEYGNIKIAAMDGMVNGLAVNLVSELARQFPRVKAEIDIVSPDSAVKGVLNGDFEFAVAANVSPDDNLVFHWTQEFPLGCIAAPDHPIAGMTSVSLKEFISHPVVFQSSAFAIRKLLEARHEWIFESAENSVVVNSVQLMKLLAVSGQYVAVTSELDAGPELKSGKLKFIPINDKDIFKQTMSLISNAQKPVSVIGQKIIRMAVQNLRTLT